MHQCLARLLRALGRRVADGDVDGLRDLHSRTDEVKAAEEVAVAGLRAAGHSWAEIGARLGISRQAAQQRWGSPTRSHDGRGWSSRTRR